MSTFDSTFQINDDDREAVAKFVQRRRNPAVGIHLQLEPEDLNRTGTTVRCVANDQAQFKRVVSAASWAFVFGAHAN